MREYFFIRGYEDFKRPGVIPESFVEKAYGFYERRGAPFLQEIKKSPSRNLLRRSSSASGGTRDAARSADLAGVLFEVRGVHAKGFKKNQPSQNHLSG